MPGKTKVTRPSSCRTISLIHVQSGHIAAGITAILVARIKMLLLLTRPSSHVAMAPVGGYLEDQFPLGGSFCQERRGKVGGRAADEKRVHVLPLARLLQRSFGLRVQSQAGLGVPTPETRGSA